MHFCSCSHAAVICIVVGIGSSFSVSSQLAAQNTTSSDKPDSIIADRLLGTSPAPIPIASDSESKTKSKSWTQFQVFVWQHKTSAFRDLQLYRDNGLNAFHIDRGANRQDNVRWATENKMPFYVDHAAGKGILHLTDEYGLSDLKQDGLLREKRWPLAAEKTTQELTRQIDANLTVAAHGPAMLIALDDEPSLGTFNSPHEVDASPVSVELYRRWLARRYGTVAKLNLQWETELTDFDQAEPVSFETVRSRINSQPFSKWNLSPWMDWRSYMDSQYAAALHRLTQYATQHANGIPVGIVGGQQPSAYGGYDYDKLRNSLQWIESYDIGGTNELLTSFWKEPRKPIVQTFFATGNQQRDEWFLWYYWAHGNRAVIAWPELKGNRPWFEDGRVQPEIEQLADTFRKIQQPKFGMLSGDKAELQTDPVAILYSHSSIQASWAADSLVHGKTWPRRSSALDNNCNSAGKNRVAWSKLLEDIGIQARWISPRDVEQGVLRSDDYKAIILPRAMSISDETCNTIRDFASNGGTVIADHWTAILDEHGKARAADDGMLQGGLDELFGITRNESIGYFDGSTFSEVNGEKYKLPFTERLPTGSISSRDLTVVERGTTAADSESSGQPAESASVVIQHKKNKSVYLNLSPVAYFNNDYRMSPAGDNLREILSDLLSNAGVTPRVRFMKDGNSIPMIEGLFWRVGDKQFLTVIGNPSRQASISSAGDTEFPLQEDSLELNFTKPISGLSELRSDESWKSGKRFNVRWKPWQALVFEIQD